MQNNLEQIDSSNSLETCCTLEDISRFRTFSGWLGLLEKILLISIPTVGAFFIIRLPGYLGISVWVEQYLAFFLGAVLAGVFIKMPAYKSAPKECLPWYDAIMALASLVVGGYLIFLFPVFQLEAGGMLYPSAITMGTITVFLLLEACRRLFGWPLVILTLLILIHALFADRFPYPFTATSFSFERLMQLLYVDQNGIMGITIKVAGILVLAFVIFGSLLSATGGGLFLVKIALSIFGPLKGGAAKTSIIASTLLGTLTGVAVACIYTTGIITIPLMKKNKIGAATAGAIEAIVATGAIIIPPVMGVVAFVMALFMNKTYAEVAIAAIIPALLYILGLYIQIDRYCAKNNVGAITGEHISSFISVLKEGWLFIIPIGILIFSLLVLMADAEISAAYATFSLFILSFFKKETRLSFKGMLEFLKSVGENTIEIGVVCGLAGVVIGSFLFTGLGLSLTEIFTSLSGGNLLLLLILSGMVCIILGMGMPIVTVYILVAILVVPVLITLDVNPMAAHMFCLYYALLSFVTPPVCLSVYAASAISNAPPMAIAFKAMRFGIIAFVAPFAFVYDPSLLIGQGDLGIVHSALSIGSGFIGVIGMGLGLEGYFVSTITIQKRVLMIISGFCCLFGPIQMRTIVASGALIFLLVEYMRHRFRQKSYAQ